jgi:hypothetical protein
LLTWFLASPDVAGMFGKLPPRFPALLSSCGGDMLAFFFTGGFKY